MRVLDLSRVLAGPLRSMILDDLGADVIKVERPGSGDETRHWGPDYPRLSRANSGLVFYSITGNGTDGPDFRRAEYDFAVQARSG